MAELRVVAGKYWRAGDMTDKTHKCAGKFACEHAQLNASRRLAENRPLEHLSDSLCGIGHKGPRCAVCDWPFYADAGGGERGEGVCVECTEEAKKDALLSLGALAAKAVLLALVFMFRTALWAGLWRVVCGEVVPSCWILTVQ